MKTECTGCGLPTEVDDYGLCNACHDKADRPQFYACGICGHCHPIAWNGDCRDDANRFTNAALDEMYGAGGWEEVEMPV